MKAIRVLLAGLVLGLAGCGDGGVQSPDFTPVLDSLVIDQAGSSQPVGRPVALTTTGRFTNPPGVTPATFPRAADPTYSVSDASVARIEGSNLIGLVQGRPVTVTATQDGKTSPGVQFTFTAPVLEDIVIQPPSATIALGAGTVSFRALGVYSDTAFTANPVPRDFNPGTAISWTSSDLGVATVSPPTGPTTVASPAATGTAMITASATNELNEPVDGSATLTVSTATLTGIARVEPPNAFLVVGGTRDYVAFGSFSDGSVQQLDPSMVTWSSTTTAIATIDANTGRATGVAEGQTVITATLVNPVAGGTTNSQTTILNVTSDVCTTPFRASLGAVVTTPTTGLLCPILCSVTTPEAVTDTVPGNVATINVPLALLTLDSQSLTATANAATTFAANGQAAGFVVARPAGALLSLELLAALSISTNNDGVLQESFTQAEDALRLTLLGTVGGRELALLAFTPTQDFDALSLTVNGGVASALSTTDVVEACATVNLTAAP